MARVVLKDVEKVYPGGVRAVKGASLEIADREFVVLVGPSGCGKSTTLRMIAGLEEISGGTIAIGERVVNDVPPKDRDIAMVFQNYALYPHMTVYDNMAFGLKLRGTDKAEIKARVGEAAEILGLQGLLERRPKELSGGQRQRVAVGRAIVRQPAAFLFDEPLSNLDAKLRVETRVELNKLHRRLATTMIYVTHDQVEAMTLGDRIVIMDDGIIQQVASPMTLYNQPINRFVAGFIGTPAMNFIDGGLEKDGDKLLFKAGDSIQVPLAAEAAQKLAARAGQAATLGVRPELLLPAADGGKLSLRGHAKATVEVVESLGDEKLVHFSCEGQTFIGKVDPQVDVRAGEKAELAVDAARVHIFDPASGENLTCTAPRYEPPDASRLPGKA
ncbi:MAG: sn-glycerol-3-phosphate ABC transporter ATP-binding protein UgpC [Planctomycetes bacterium]|nr:sn-glycerol-3-phosphate ABC transporter ATP-binding protein UgpC [Planctomycetota bacterium]